MPNKNKTNKKAQVGETVTWIVATVIIIVILVFSIFLAKNIFGDKKITFSKKVDTFASKSFFSWLLTEDDSKETIYSKLKQEGDLNDFNGNLAISVFDEYYGRDYEDVWVGIIFNRTFNPFPPNDYFGERPFETRGGDVNRRTISHITELIMLDTNKSIELALRVNPDEPIPRVVP